MGGPRGAKGSPRIEAAARINIAHPELSGREALMRAGYEPAEVTSQKRNNLYAKKNRILTKEKVNKEPDSQEPLRFQTTATATALSMEDEVTRKLKRAAVELGIDLIDLRTTEEEAELIAHCKLPKTLQTKGKLRRLIREEQQPPVFLVSARVKGALRSNRARGNVYKALEKHNGLFSKSEGKQVTYEGDDLVVRAYFEDSGKAMSFQTSINEWELQKVLLLIDGVEINPPDPEPVRKPHDLTRFYLQYYKPQDSESTCQTLDQL